MLKIGLRTAVGLYLISQRSLHNAPIFRLLLKVAVKGTHQCDCINFWGALAPTSDSSRNFGSSWNVDGTKLGVVLQLTVCLYILRQYYFCWGGLGFGFLELEKMQNIACSPCSYFILLLAHKVGLHGHTFSAFWLWSSVVSVLISVTTDMSPTGDLIVTSIFVWGGAFLSLLRGLRVLRQNCTSLVAAHPLG